MPRPEHKKGRIEIIPMIDAIFFLLVYFIMISLSMVQMETHGVTLPKSRTARLDVEQKVVVAITRKGEVYVDQNEVAEDALRNQIAAYVDANPDVSVVISCDRDRSVAQFLRVFDLVKQANAANVMIATEPRR